MMNEVLSTTPGALYGIIAVVGYLTIFLTLATGFGDSLFEGLGEGIFELELFDDIGLDIGDTRGLGVLISAFMAAFGTGGFLVLLNDGSTLESLLGAFAFGMILAYVMRRTLGFVFAQESQPGEGIYSKQDMLYKQAVMLIDLPAGRTGEAIVRTGEARAKISVRSKTDVDLFRDDVVEVRGIEGNLFLVERRQIEDSI